MLVSDFMTANPVTISPDTTHMEAVNLMRENGFRRLPVQDRKGSLVGIVVEKDLLSTQPSPATSLSIWEIHGLLSKLKVKDFMSHPVYTVGAACPIEDAARIMIAKRIGCLPVMDGEALVGIVTETDIFKILTDMMAGGEPGARITVRLHHERGVLAELAKAIASINGQIVSVSTFHDADESFKRVTLKVAGANVEQLRDAIAAHADWEIMDTNQDGDCHQPRAFGK